MCVCKTRSLFGALSGIGRNLTFCADQCSRCLVGSVARLEIHNNNQNNYQITIKTKPKTTKQPKRKTSSTRRQQQSVSVSTIVFLDGVRGPKSPPSPTPRCLFLGYAFCFSFFLSILLYLTFLVGWFETHKTKLKNKTAKPTTTKGTTKN